MNDEHLSQTKKSKAARQWRCTTRQRKRFDGTLKEFIKVKYNAIFDEYVEFYNLLDKKYPNMRELSKTRMFKKWAKTVREEQTTESGSEGSQVEGSVEVQPCLDSCQDEAAPNQLVDQLDISYQDEAAPDQLINQQASQLDILSVALQEALSGVIPVRDQEAVLDDNNVVEDIISELEQDEAIQAILDPVIDDIMNGHDDEIHDILNNHNNEVNQDDDEGIGLNLVDEIEFDIEPLDYNLEVDNYDF